jgi:hypothetical protein
VRITLLGLLFLLAGCSGTTTPAVEPSGPVPGAPLVVGPHDHVVVLEYEAWFGPKAENFSDAEAMPILQSPDMKPFGGGYDSADPRVIAQHIDWMRYMGVDAALVDISNNVGCIFSTGPVSRRYCVAASQAFRANNRAILRNDANLYPAWTALHTNLKLIPLIGCQTLRDVTRDPAGDSGFQKAIEYFGRLMAQYPGLSIVYKGHPLMLVYLGTPASPRLLRRCNGVIRVHGFAQQYTFRFMSGYLDSQWPFWKNPSEEPGGPIEISSRYDFWSWVDRYRPAYHLWPTYSTVPGYASQPENFTVSIAVAGTKGWGCPKPRYCVDASLRYGRTRSTYVTLQRFMKLAAQLKPTFLIVHQFNEFTMADEGWNAQTSDDIEPTRLPKGWEYTAVDAVHADLAAYRRAVSRP